MPWVVQHVKAVAGAEAPWEEVPRPKRPLKPKQGNIGAGGLSMAVKDAGSRGV